MRAQSIGILILLLTLVSCNKNDGYSLGDFRIDIGTVQKEDNNSFSLELDNGKKLFPMNPHYGYHLKENQRVFINYTLLSGEHNQFDHLVKINDMWNILTKDVIDLTTANEDSIGNDPIKINHIWVGKDFLNIDFLFNYGGVRPHAINLVKNKLNPELNENVIELEFRHNSYESNNSRLVEGLVSFDLKPFQREDSDQVSISVKVKDWDATATYDLTYKYKDVDLQSTYVETPILVVASDEYY